MYKAGASTKQKWNYKLNVAKLCEPAILFKTHTFANISVCRIVTQMASYIYRNEDMNILPRNLTAIVLLLLQLNLITATWHLYIPSFFFEKFLISRIFLVTSSPCWLNGASMLGSVWYFFIHFIFTEPLLWHTIIMLSPAFSNSGVFVICGVTDLLPSKKDNLS